jgi:hypothetical protein
MAVIIIGWQRDTVKVMGWKLACAVLASQWPIPGGGVSLPTLSSHQGRIA